MNKKGFASSTIIYGLLSIFLIAISILIYTMNSNVSLNKSLNEKTIENIEYGSSSLSELENRITELEKNKNELETKINKLETKSILEETYPVGSIYISTSSTNPGEIFGGEWEKYAQGRTLVGEGTGTDISGNVMSFTTKDNITGGEYKHTLSASELPVIEGVIQGGGGNSGTTGGGLGIFRNAGGVFTPVTAMQYRPDFSTNTYGTSSASYWSVKMKFGGDESHNNIQPYIVTYMYKRVK